jgi:uncharacterized membrane protein
MTKASDSFIIIILLFLIYLTIFMYLLIHIKISHIHEANQINYGRQGVLSNYQGLCYPGSSLEGI